MTVPNKNGVLDKIMERAAELRELGPVNESLGRLDDKAAKVLRDTNPIQRFWRDAHMGLAHAIHVPGSVYHASALTDLDVEVPQGPMRSMI